MPAAGMALAAALAASTGPDLVGVLVAARVVDLTARFEGALVEVTAGLGATVEAGAVVARLASPEVEEDAASARAALVAAEAEAAHAGDRHARLEALGGLVSGQEVADARLQRQLAAARARAARARLADLAERAAGALLVAPFRGIVARRYLEAGARVSAGAAIVRLLDAAEVRVRFALDEESARGLAAGAAFEVLAVPGTPWSPPGGRLGGSITGIAPDRDPVVGLKLVEGRLEADPAALPIGLEVRVRLGGGE